MFSTADTIVAMATPPGRGGMGVVRLSGAEAHRMACGLAGLDALEPRHATFARIVEPGANAASAVVDQVVMTYFAAPRSFTGDDVVEISGHGSPVLMARIIELSIAAGARLAEPGEFTFRAYVNGRIDLVQAEAVADLVNAVTPLQARAAMDQLEGTLTSEIQRIDGILFDLIAKLEASLDFPDEGFHFITRPDAARELQRVRRGLAALVQDGRAGRVVREGSLVVISGRPNAGKSSLFNALAGAARAIVTGLPGTTRDVLTERVDIGGIPVTLVDTAGLRDTREVIEAEGVRRARDARRIAALNLLVIDGSAPGDGSDQDREEAGSAPQIVVLSKSDLPRARPVVASGAIEVSIVTGEGLLELRAAIVRALTARDDWRDTPAISNLRHLNLVSAALASVETAEAALAAGATEELALADLAHARRALEEIRGQRAPDELVHHIFAKFCVGK